MRIRYAVIAAGALLTVGCGTSVPGPPVTVTAEVTVTAPIPATSEAAGVGAGSPGTARTVPKKTISAGKKVRVPNVVGTNHQLAQDTLQAKGFFLLQEMDASGQGRLLIWDRNWVVVRQSPKGGTLADPATATVTLYSKKIGE